MSRCYPFPPPGYEKNGYSGEALIQWLKSERKRVRAKVKKEKKKEKKTKGERKGENKIWNENLIVESEVNHETRQKHDPGDPQKKIEVEAEQLEKSGVTDEDEQPSDDQNMYESSANTQNRNKLNNLSSPGNHHYSRKHDLETVSSMQNSCRAARLEMIPPEKAESVFKQEMLCSTFGRVEIRCEDNAELASLKNLQLRDVIKKWVPPSSQLEDCDFDDMDWLFEKNQHHGSKAKKFKSNSSALFIDSSSMWPYACHLPEVDVYALPYTVPY